MKFITNRISTGKSTGFSDFVTKLAASNASLAKTAQVSNFGDKQAKPFGAKEEGKETEPKKDAKKEGEEKEACETSCASNESSVKTAKEDKKETAKDGVMKVKMQKMDPVGGTNTGKPGGEKKKASNSDVDPANKGVTHKVDECCGAPTSKTDDGSESPKSEKKTEKKEVTKVEVKAEEKKASVHKWVKISNLDSKTKNAWKAYWKNLYPTEYVDAMFADK